MGGPPKNLTFLALTTVWTTEDQGHVSGPAPAMSGAAPPSQDPKSTVYAAPLPDTLCDCCPGKLPPPLMF